ncbi:MAG TPA: hypothetical protein DCX95_06580 [Elusimicrobia bacterium]|nr:hypothetical protein [Elusimicrobiota bacterium]
MKKLNCLIAQSFNRCRAYTLVEIMIAMVVLVLGLIPLVKLIGDSLVATSDLGSRSVANELAQDLLEEIKQRKWDENAGADGLTAAGALSAIGLDGETATNKTTFDDIDDYNALQGANAENPPKDASNTAMAQYSKFTRSVRVRYKTYNANGTFSDYGGGAPYTDYKEITVTVSWTSGGGKTREVIHQTIMANIARR